MTIGVMPNAALISCAMLDVVGSEDSGEELPSADAAAAAVSDSLSRRRDASVPSGTDGTEPAKQVIVAILV